MKKIVKLTETDLTRLVKRTINEMEDMDETMSYDDFYDTISDLMGEFFEDFDSMSSRYLDAANEMYDNVKDNENLDKDDKYELLDQIQEFQDDLGSLLEKYYQFRKKESCNPREFEVFLLLSAGESVNDISSKLHMSSRTVFNYQTTIRKKMGLYSHIEFNQYALRHQLIQSPP
jgi:DNA-binding CsgD family transcriptional regulator